jgi:hypothetical protein
MKNPTSPLPFETVALAGFTHKATLDFNDLIALGAVANGVIQLFPTVGNAPAGTVARRVALNLTTPFVFSDGTITGCVAEVGDGNSTARLCAQTQLATAGTPVPYFAQSTTYAYPIADSIDIKFTAAGGATHLVNTATAGQVDVYLELVNINDLAAA